MTLLILGVALWWAAHLFKRLAPGPRARMGNAGRGVAAVLILLSVVLMVVGYRGAETVQLWHPPAFLTHVNNLLMVFAFYLYAADGLKTAVTRKIRHPQLTAFKTWTVAHLLVNGDLASVILFGGLLAWAVVTALIVLGSAFASRSLPDLEPWHRWSFPSEPSAATLRDMDWAAYQRAEQAVFDELRAHRAAAPRPGRYRYQAQSQLGPRGIGHERGRIAIPRREPGPVGAAAHAGTQRRSPPCVARSGAGVGARGARGDFWIQPQQLVGLAPKLRPLGRPAVADGRRHFPPVFA